MAPKNEGAVCSNLQTLCTDVNRINKPIPYRSYLFKLHSHNYPLVLDFASDWFGLLKLQVTELAGLEPEISAVTVLRDNHLYYNSKNVLSHSLLKECCFVIISNPKTVDSYDIVGQSS